MELLYADDLVLMAESKELLMGKLKKLEKKMEAKGLRVNAGKRWNVREFRSLRWPSCYGPIRPQSRCYNEFSVCL